MAESSREEIAKLEALYAGNPGGRVFVHLAEAYRKAGEHERARRILDEGLGRHVDSASGHVVLGRVLADMQLTGEAEAAFRRVLALDSGNLVALRWLGDLSRQSGRNAEAAAHYRELLIRNPSNEEVRDLVEIVEREAVSPAPRGVDADEGFPDEIADWSADAGETALSGPVSDAEERSVGAPASVGGTDPDVTSWSAAPGDTGATPEAEVEFGLVEIEGLTAEAGETQEPMTLPGVPEGEDELEFVASLDDDDADLLELDELRRDDEAEPMEIHLLDPSYEPSEDDAEEFAGELDLSDLEAAASFEEDVEYADDSFIADLSAAGKEEPPVDELASGVDLISDGSALTLLPDDGEAAPGEAGPSAPPIEDEVSVPSWGESRDEAAGHAAEYANEAADEAAADEIAGDFEFTAGGLADAGTGLEFNTGTEGAISDSIPVGEGGDGGAEDDSEAVEAESDVPGQATLGELSGAAERATEAEPAPEPAATAEPVVERDIGLVTETMAVLYRSQGFHERAADVYRALLRARPGDERLAARLREAEAASRPPAAAAAADESEDAGEVWLRGVATAWSAGKDAGAAATPYAWTADAEDVDEAEAGEPIGSYLNDLVTWKAGSRRWMEQPSEPAPGPGDAGGDIDLPDWLNDPAGGESWTPDSPAAGGGGLPAADAGWSPAESVEESDPWAVPDEPALDADPWAVPEPASDVDPWAPVEPAAETEPWDVPGGPVDAARALESQLEAQSHVDQPDAADAAPSASDTSPQAAAPEESGGAWTPLDLDGDVSAAAGPVEPLPPLPEQSGSDEDSGEDEDLEMFRSWLQSLKK